MLTGGFNLDLTAVGDEVIRDIEQIGFNNLGQTTLTVAASDVRAMNDANSLLVQNGTAPSSVQDDTVQLAGRGNCEGSTAGVHRFQFGETVLDADVTTLSAINELTIDADAPLGFENATDILSITSGAFIEIQGLTTLTVDTGTLHIQSGADFDFGSGNVVTANGGVFLNEGNNVGGNSPGLVSVTGDMTLGHTSSFEAELGGLAPGVHEGYDQMLVTGTLNAAGRIDVVEFGDFEVSAGDSFSVVEAGTLNGGFDDITGLDVGGGVVLDAAQSDTGVTLTGRAVTHQGTGADDTLTGGSGNDVIAGGDGGDFIVGGGGADLMHGGAGDDVFVASDTGFGRIDGGDGIDIVRFEGAGQSFDLGGLRGDQINAIEGFDLSGSGDNTLTLDADMVLAATRGANALTGGDNSLLIDGDAGDAVDAGAGWSNTGSVTIGGEGYSVFESADNGAQLFVDTNVAVSTG